MMKKKKFFLIFFILLLIGCTSKRITKDEFIDKATFNGYIIKEDKSGYEDYSKIKSVYYAISREYEYDIQFLELEDDDYAHKFFLYNVDDFNEKVTSNDYKKTSSNSIYELYHAESDSNYYLIIRSGANIIYIDAPINYINEIEEFLHDLQLKY